MKNPTNERNLFAELETSIRLRVLAEVYHHLAGKTVSFGEIEKAFGVDRGQLHRLIQRYFGKTDVV